MGKDTGSCTNQPPLRSGLCCCRKVGDRFRPSEVEILQGDASKAKAKLGWEPKIKFKELVKIMIEHDLKELRLQNLTKQIRELK